MEKRKVNRFLTLLLLFGLFLLNANAQNSFVLQGTVVDQNNEPLPGASLLLKPMQIVVSTDENGNFRFPQQASGNYELNVTFVGFITYKKEINLSTSQVLTIQLNPDNLYLNEVDINEYIESKKQDSQNIEFVDHEFLNENQSGSLMQTLRRMPGINSIDIGSGQSKPVIRGLSFNRVVVAENGIKHEGQEWGTDHGLEIDQYAVERVEVIKGPASLMYGSNAIGGVIDIKQLTVPRENTTGGKLMLGAKSNNQYLGSSAMFFTRKNKFYAKARFSISDYSDYRVPTDSIEYLTYYFRLKDHQLRNTAGLERNGSFTLGYVTPRFISHLSFSNFYSKSGFFADAHGLEIRTSTIDYDQSNRDIDLPYQWVNHFKFISNNHWHKNNYHLNVDFAYQNNLRQEFAEAVAHGHMPIPSDSLERGFNKDTWSLNSRFVLAPLGMHLITTGASFEFQKNEINGWGFIFPAFRNFNSGAFVYDKISLSDRWNLNTGVRYDYGQINIDSYYDWFPTRQEDESDIYIQRAFSIQRTFNNLTWAVGANYNNESYTVKVNLGKSFRMPIAKELAANGVNYHMYRFEKGDSSLNAEVSYQLDCGFMFNQGSWDLSISPFVNYFPNYIYLNPTANYYEALQVYQHQESEVFRTGGEFVVGYKISPALSISVDAEYIYSIQMSGEKRGYTLPFSPPFSCLTSFMFTPDFNGFIHEPEFSIEYRIVGAQNNIVPPEKRTAGYEIVNLSMGGKYELGKQKVQLNFRVSNLFNKKYYDHTSFYRLIEVPGPGRNFVFSIQLPFGKSL